MRGCSTVRFSLSPMIEFGSHGRLLYASFSCGLSLIADAGHRIDSKKRGLGHPEKCPLCDQEDETIDHILVACVFARDFWSNLLRQVPIKMHAYVGGGASSASYFLIGAAITEGTVTVEGCGTTSLQLGASVEEGLDYCFITPPEKLNVTVINTYDDQRMAMAFSLAAGAVVPVTIRDPGCTRKTFPDYLDVLSSLARNLAMCLKRTALELSR